MKEKRETREKRERKHAMYDISDDVGGETRVAMESQMVALHFPNVFCHLSEIILHLANAFGGTSNTVCPFVDFVFHLSEIQNVDCTLHFSQLTLSILQVKT